jgi:hypothetical protein
MADLIGALQSNSTLQMQLCGYGSQVPRISGTGMIAKTSPIAVKAGGTGIITMSIWGNDVITPAGTYYTFAVADDQGNVVQLNAYQFAGAGTYDLSSAALYDPPPPSILSVNPVLRDPAGAATQTINGSITINGDLTVTGQINNTGGVYVLPWAANLVLDGHLGSSFKCVLGGDTTISVANLGGNSLVPLRLVQDGAGGHAVTWAGSIRNAGVVSPAANSRSVYLFAADKDGSLDAASPVMYS